MLHAYWYLIPGIAPDAEIFLWNYFLLNMILFGRIEFYDLSFPYSPISMSPSLLKLFPIKHDFLLHKFLIMCSFFPLYPAFSPMISDMKAGCRVFKDRMSHAGNLSFILRSTLISVNIQSVTFSKLLEFFQLLDLDRFLISVHS